jgi:hypothetical protein
MAISVTLRFNGSVDMIADPTLLARIDLISHAARLAQDLQKEYAGAVAYRVRTAEEERVRLAKEQAEDKRRKVQRMAEYPSKGLRAGGNPRTVSRELFTGCEDGQYEVSYDEGRRNCRVTLRAGSATIRRLA